MALLVLVLTFGSLVGAGLPILSAIIGVGLGMTGITAMTAFFDIGSSTPMLATMIGLAVGIDYSLFILARYRTELHDDRRPRGSHRRRCRYVGFGRRLRRPDGADRTVRAGGRRHPVPDRDGSGGSRHGVRRRHGRADPAAGDSSGC